MAPATTRLHRSRQTTVSIYAEYQRELQKLKFDRNTLTGKLEGAAKTLKVLKDSPDAFRVPETEIAAVLVNNPAYKDLLPRQQMLQSIVDSQQPLLVRGQKPSPTAARAKAELDSTDNAVRKMRDNAKDQVREAKQVELERETDRLRAEIDIATEQIGTFEKEVESKQRDADSVGKSSIAAQTYKATLENTERSLQSIVDERDRLKVELQSPTRVSLLGDRSSAGRSSRAGKRAPWVGTF